MSDFSEQDLHVSLSESDLLALWNDFLKQIARRYTETIASLWFSEAIPIGLRENNLFLLVEVEFKRNTVDIRYRAELEKFFSTQLGAPIYLCLYSLPQARKIPYFEKNEEYLRARTRDMFWALFPTRLFSDERIQQKDPTHPNYFNMTEEEREQVSAERRARRGDKPFDLERVARAFKEDFEDAVRMVQEGNVPKIEPLPDNPDQELAAQIRAHIAQGQVPTDNDQFLLPDAPPTPSAPSSSVPSVPSEATPVAPVAPIAPAPKKERDEDVFDFDHFIVGNSNRLAHAACIAVAREPAREYNPLFIWGQSGLGKTHLLKAIISRVKREHPEMKIKYVKGEEFTNQMVESITYNRTEQFRESYRTVDILLIDDIQFIAGRESTQEEFFHTFNALYENQKQIILTSDRPPKEILRLEERLRTRFEWGMIADITPPDLDLRVAILKKKAELSDLELPNDIAIYIAQNLSSNVRQLEGAIKKIYANVVLLGNPLTMETVVSCIADLMTGAEPVAMTVEKILNRVAQKYEVSVESIKGTRRTKSIVQARHVAIYLIRELTAMSFPQLGKLFSKDHSSVMSSYNKIEEAIKKEDPFALEIRELQRAIKE